MSFLSNLFGNSTKSSTPEKATNKNCEICGTATTLDKMKFVGVVNVFINLQHPDIADIDYNN
ncbi:hypothetical protein [Botryobacter ruber]|uniref:hypothetical protein n=1 Tax=Botryobacter ruber TaxID=2171629 RepID=UPI000F651436|nr:hypothetical protein [Botryobacter ruber]